MREGRLQAWFEGPRWLAFRVLADVVALVAATALAVLVTPDAGSIVPSLLFPVLTFVLLAGRGRYRPRLMDAVLENLAPGVGAVSIGAMLSFVLGATLAGQAEAGGARLVATWVVGVVAVTVAGGLLVVVQQFVRRRQVVSYPTLIVGADALGVDIAGRLERNPAYGLRPVGFIDGADVAHPPGLGDTVPPVVGGFDDVQELVERHGVSHVIIGFPDAPWRDLRSLVSRCDELGLRSTVVPRLYGTINHRTQFEYLGTMPLLNLRAIDAADWRFGIKHAIDRVVAGVLLLLLAPTMLILAAAVKLSSPGPVFYRQLRAGRDGQLFELLKFRTMHEAAEGDQAFVPQPGMAPGGIEGEDRRSSVGRILRRLSLDELPQLINVLRGEMSVVGPRPERPEYAELFRESIERYQDRARVKSGITGWAQVHGLRGQTSLAHRVELDNFYIEHWSLGLDLRIVLLTIPELFRGR